MMNINATEAQLLSVCFTYDHSFGLQSPDVRTKMVVQAKYWWQVVSETEIKLQPTQECIDSIIFSMNDNQLDIVDARCWISAVIKEVNEPSYLSKQPEKIEKYLVGTEENNISKLFK